jgi:glutaredoxin
MRERKKRKMSRNGKKRRSFCSILMISFLLFLLPPILITNVSGGDNNNETTKDNKVVIYFFWGQGCPHCAKERLFLENLQEKYPQLEVKKFETWHNQENALFFIKMAEAYGTKASGVPTTFIGNNHIVGYGSDEITGKKIEELVKGCIEEGCINPIEKLSLKREICMHIFIKSTCPQCQEIMPYLNNLGDRYNIELNIYDILNESNKRLYEKFKEIYNAKGSEGYPTIFIGDKYLVGNKAVKEHLEREIKNCLEKTCPCPTKKIKLQIPHLPGPSEFTPEESKLIDLPIFGKINAEKISLPLLTIIIAALDGFNPCAIWVLCFLLTLLIYAKSRFKILLIGGIFVITSGAIYFLFMAAWLNFFLFVGYFNIMKLIIALIALIAGGINIKDFFFFKKGGLSLTIPDSAKPKLYKKMRNLVKASQLPSIIIGTIFLAIFVNFIELLCTLGLPAIYTRILTLNNLPILTYYLYLLLYNIVYVIPLGTIVLIFAYTLGKRKFTEKEGRILKLISGLLMSLLGIIMLFKPELLMFG